jgi:uncharacterized sporulation protein YeaH/YhbH (DUF444 family)
MTTLIDARNRGRDKSADNRARFLRRFRGLLRTKVADLARQRSIRDGVEGAEVELSPHDISEPRFTHKSGSGHDARVLPGNDRFTRGQTIPRNPHEGAEGSGTGAPGEGQAEDAFRFVLSRDEYLSILFDDLELPKLLRMQRADITETRIRRAGYTRQGIPGTLAVSRTMKTSLSRRIALTGALRQQLAQYHAALAALVLAPEASPDDAGVFESARAQVQILEALIADVESRLQRVPFLDELDLRFRAAVPVKLPRTAAVMLCLMDVSSSMDEDLKDTAKRFFLLLYLFLERKYDRIELVFIRHTDDAEECTEQDFFHGTKSGGTRVLAGLHKVNEVAKRFDPAQWNIYLAQASDGDAFGDDGARSARYLNEVLRPMLRFAIYLGVGNDEHSTLARNYRNVADGDFLTMAHAANRDQVYPAFRTLFLPRTST